MAGYRYCIIQKRIELPDSCDCLSKYNIRDYINDQIKINPEFLGKIEVENIVKTGSLEWLGPGRTIQELREGHTLE